MQSKLTAALAAGVFLSALVLASVACQPAWAWSNGGYGDDPANPVYGTHDWIAQHALDWLPAGEKQFLIDNLACYLYGTELPDNANTPDGVGDTTKHHVYFFANGSLQDDASAVRARTEFANAVQAFELGNFSGAAERLGMVTHYVSDVAVFGHDMGAATEWGAEKHHSDYESYVLTRTNAYSDDFNVYLCFDDFLSETSAYEGALAVARDTTFGGSSGLGCSWMDQHYNWSDAGFKGQCGASLNLAVNAVADVLHGFAVAEGLSGSPAPSAGATPSPIASTSGSSSPTPTLPPTQSPAQTPNATPTATSTPSLPELTAVSLLLTGTGAMGLIIYRRRKAKVP
jgi:hypothetical protein